jgi:tripeptidyl-peptidase I
MPGLLNMESATIERKLSKGMNWLKFDATVEEAETLLQTEYGVYENVETGKTHLACDDYSIPHQLRESIDFITPTIQFDAIAKTRMKRRDLDDSVKPSHGGKKGATVPAASQVTYSLANCNTYITSDCLRALYNFTNGTLAQEVLCLFSHDWN